MPCHDEYRDQVDTLRYRVHAQVTLPQKDIRVVVAVTALVAGPDSGSAAIRLRIREALREFIAADWVLSRIRRDSATAGYERIELMASVRVPPEENHHLEERARAASRDGLTIGSPEVDYALPAERITAAVQKLREQILVDVQAQMARFNEVSGRNWRLGDVEFGVESGSWQEGRRSGKGALLNDSPRIFEAAADPADESGLTGAERIELLAGVMLKAMPP